MNTTNRISLPFKLAIAIELFIAMLGSALSGISGRGAPYILGFGTPEHIGKLFLTTYLFPFEVASLLLLVAAIGAVVLARRRRGLEEEDVEEMARVLAKPRPSYTGTIAPSGDSTIQATGIFTLLGTPHPITIPILVHLAGESATAKAHFVVPYVQWGLKNPSFLIWKADNDVAIDLTLTGRLSK